MQIRKALEKNSEVLLDYECEVYLQGSYANRTNIRKDSDVDVVVQLNSTFYYDIFKLTQEQKRHYNETFFDATNEWTDFRRDVIAALMREFGPKLVRPGNKSIKVRGDRSRINADVVPCFQYRKYRKSANWDPDNFIEGMKFWTAIKTPSKERLLIFQGITLKMASTKINVLTLCTSL